MMISNTLQAEHQCTNMQNADVNYLEDTRCFDQMGLLSSLLEKLDKVELTNQIAITAEKFDAAISGVTVDLWEAMMVWIQVDK